MNALGYNTPGNSGVVDVTAEIRKNNKRILDELKKHQVRKRRVPYFAQGIKASLKNVSNTSPSSRRFIPIQKRQINIMPQPRRPFEAQERKPLMQNFFEHKTPEELYPDSIDDEPGSPYLRLLDLNHRRSTGSTGSLFGF
jgi:hypothetical protein